MRELIIWMSSHEGSNDDRGFEFRARSQLDGSELANSGELDDVFTAMRMAVDRKLVEEQGDE